MMKVLCENKCVMIDSCLAVEERREELGSHLP